MSEANATEPRLRVWFLVLGQAPVAVVDVTGGDEPGQLAGMLGFALRNGGMVDVPAFYGHELERTPPRLAWHLDDELTLADEQGERILRLPADRVDPQWRDRALAVKGCATYVAAGIEADAEAGARVVCDALDERARAGAVVAAIVGVGSSRATLPLFG